MGEGLYDELARLERGIGEHATPVRIYAPVGSHKELLAYLVRRLLENGANSSFVNRIADEDVPIDDLVRDPVAELAALEPKRNPAIPLPDAIFGAARRNSAGVDLSDPLVREPLLGRLDALEARLWAPRRRLVGRAQKTSAKEPGRWSRPTNIAKSSAVWSTRARPRSIARFGPLPEHSPPGMHSAARRVRCC